MARYAINALTGKFDRISEESGPGGDISISGDSGPTLTGDEFDIIGQTAGTSNTPVVEVDTTSGDIAIANNAWDTPYVVDSSTVTGLKGTYSTIQSAIDAAVSDGASLSSQKMIYIRYGTYTEDLTIPPGIFLKGEMMLSTPGAIPNYTLIQGVHEVAGANVFRAQGVSFLNPDSALDLFTNLAGTVIFNFTSCIINNGSSSGVGFTSDFNFNELNNCIFIGTSQQPIIHLTAGSMRIVNCFFATSPGISNSGTIFMYNSSGMGEILNASGNVIAYNCQFTGDANCVSGIGIGNEFNNCQFNCTTAAIDLPSFSCVVTDCSILSGSDANLATDTTILNVTADQIGNVLPHRLVDADYNVTNDDYLLLVDSTAAPITLTFPTAGTSDRSWVVKDLSGTSETNAITLVVTGGKTIDGAASYVLSTNYKAIEICRYDGENFVTIATNISGGGGSPFSSIVVNGPTTLNGAQIEKFITTATDYNVLITDYGVSVTNTSSPRSIVLPSAGVQAGQTFEIKDTSGNATVNNITITVNGGVKTIDNELDLKIIQNYQGWVIRYDGTNYWTR